jgi:hypothetical protein
MQSVECNGILISTVFTLTTTLSAVVTIIRGGDEVQCLLEYNLLLQISEPASGQQE